MDRRSFFRKLIQPQNPGDTFPLEESEIPHLTKALRKEPEILSYSGSDDSTTSIFTYHLERWEEERPAGILILSVELSSTRLTGEVNLTDMAPGRSPVRHCLSDVSRFGTGDDHVTFHRPGMTVWIYRDYRLRVVHEGT